jgi:hypothetical protein
MTNSEYLLNVFLAEMEAEVFAEHMLKQTEDEILIMFDHLNTDEPVDPGVPDNFNL